MVSFFSNRESTPGPVDLAAGAAGASPPAPPPSRRGLDFGGASPGLKLSGRSAAAPAPPPVHPSMGPSHSMPSEVTPPTMAFLTFAPSFSSDPIVATTTRFPASTFEAFVTIVRGSSPPTSTLSSFSLSLPRTSSHSSTRPAR